MKKIAITTALLLSYPLLFAQDTTSVEGIGSSPELGKAADAPSDKAQVDSRYQEVIDAFSNLPEETRVEFLKKRNEASVLFQNKRIFEALEASRELIEIFPDDPQTINLRGACYVELRDFGKATEQFELSKAITGPSFNVMFNIAEVAFVAEKWKESLQGFKDTLELAPENATQMRRLVEFKIMLCEIALGKDSSLSEEERKQHTATAKEMSQRYDYTDDSPYYYYANAAINYAEDNDTEGLNWLNKGRRVYSANAQQLASWEDTMTEYGYIKSYYGNDKAHKEDELSE
ncbi:tetratricopeptide repeat protein [Rubritalea spongiae]|uniref:Tetratricopeptide repeat protein n=1 Tax=Rubritalea spongiae TaxID=430797 RepID=A0ABW5E3K6_9BACT